MTKIAIAILFLFFLAPGSTKLKVVVKNIKVGQGSVFIAIYDKDEAFFKKAYASVELPSDKTEMGTDFDLPQGEYAVSVYQDINGNKKLDFGIFHIPNEPTGFSNNFRPRFSAPQFKDAAIKLNQPSATSVIELK